MRSLALIALLAASPALADDSEDLKQAGLAIAARQYDEAASTIASILDDPSRAEAHPAAWARLGDLWADHGLPESALLAWATALEADPAALGASLPRALEVAAEVGDEGALEPHLVTLPVGLAEPARTRAAMLGARELVRTGRFAEAVSLLGAVPTDHPDYARAQDLRGIALANQGMYAESLAALLTANAAAAQAPTEVRARVIGNLGRAYYGAGNYLKAVEYLGSIPRESPTWQDHLVEHAWARFAIEDHAGTLSVLYTLETPYFVDWYTAEADLLRVQAYFLLCKFASAGDEVDRFIAKYTPISEGLAAALPGMDEQAAWSDARDFATGAGSRLPPAILHRFAHEERFLDALGAVARIDAEAATVSAASEPWMRRAEPLLAARRAAVVQSEGARVLGRAGAAQAELSDLLDRIPLVKLDILDVETTMYDQAAATGRLDYGDRIGRLRSLRKTRGARSWPVDENEIWADELGWYRVDVRSDCPEDSPR